MSALPATMNICGVGAGARATASLRSFPATLNEDQRGPRTDDATSAHAHFQFAGADAPWQRPAPRSLLPRGAGHPIHAIRLHSGRMQSFSDQLVSQGLADLVVHSNRLSSPSTDGLKTIGKALTYEAQPLSPDDKIYD